LRGTASLIGALVIEESLNRNQSRSILRAVEEVSSEKRARQADRQLKKRPSLHNHLCTDVRWLILITGKLNAIFPSRLMIRWLENSTECSCHHNGSTRFSKVRDPASVACCYNLRSSVVTMDPSELSIFPWDNSSLWHHPDSEDTISIP
jgi:hypothetical protein